jgi:hypothetical protein
MSHRDDSVRSKLFHDERLNVDIRLGVDTIKACQ